MRVCVCVKKTTEIFFMVTLTHAPQTLASSKVLGFILYAAVSGASVGGAGATYGPGLGMVFVDVWSWPRYGPGLRMVLGYVWCLARYGPRLCMVLGNKLSQCSSQH